MIYEIAVYVGAPREAHRVQPGDVVSVRPPTPGMGVKERALPYVRLLIEVDPQALAPLLSRPAPGMKKRLHVPLGRLRQLQPDFDFKRAADPQDCYQPFMPVDARGLFIQGKAAPPIRAQGLIRDKLTGRDL